jgi:Holliday junction resolvasome RuvABC DNA-binding subunit
MLQSEAFASQDEAVEALITLGYSFQDAAKALAPIPKDITTEERVKQALKH